VAAPVADLSESTRPPPAEPAGLPDGPIGDRLVEQLDWYSRKSRSHKRGYQWGKVGQIVVAAAIPVVAAAGASAAVAGALGAVVVVLEGLQQLFQFQPNWSSYRATAEALKHEQYLYLARAGGYEHAPERDRLLAERIESLVSQEHAAWSAAQKPGGASRTPSG
jgi:hypothetical protein